MNNNSTVLVSTLQVRKWTLCLLSFLIALPLLAQKGDKGGDELNVRASELFEAGKFAEAYPLYSQLLSLKPNDPDYNFKFGASSLYAGVPKETALKHINYALKKNCSDSRIWFYLGKAHHLNYDFSAAASAYRSYLDKVDPKDKNILPAKRNLEMCDQGGKLLSNIRDVVVLEKTEAAESDFFRYYNLEEIGGRVLRTPDDLLSKYDKKMGLVSVMHYPGDATTIYFTSYGKDGATGKDLYKADILPGGTYSTPERLPDGINTDEDEDFAFMHPDGKSFYFASRGHNSMGGYDIFRSDYNRMTGSFAPPVNLDFAINTPDDDLFYVIDSLKQTAYFASGRTSAQGALHVYKVLVESLPLNLMFIAGDYLPEAEGLDDQAKLVLMDELTGRTIAETTASASRGGYFLELPKAGNYRIEVQPLGGAVRHSGVFTVPNYDESVALKQELRIVNENGIERLIITNSFNDPLDVNLAQLAADALRRRSALDPNATEERIEAAREQQTNGSLREELAPERIVQEAGFAAGETLDTVLAKADDRVEQIEEQAKRFESNAGAYLAQAAAAQIEANKKTAEARKVINEAAESEGAAYLAAVNRYNALLSEANQAATTAQNLLESAERLTEASIQLNQLSQQQIAVNDKLRELTSAENWSAAKEALIKLRNAEASEANPAASTLKTQLDEADRSAVQADKRLENQVNEKEVIGMRVQQLKRELEAASKKADKERLNEQLVQAETEAAAVEVDIRAAQTKVVEMRKEAQALRSQLKLVEAASAENLAQGEASTWSSEQANQLRAQIEAAHKSLTELNDQAPEMASAITDTETKRDFGVELLPTIAARSAENNIELIPLQVRNASYSEQTASIQANPSTAAYKQRALDELQLVALTAHLNQLRELALIELPTAEREALELELKSTEETLRNLNESLLASANTPDTSSGRQVLDQRFPDYAQLRTAEKGNDLEQTLRRVERAEAIEERLRNEQNTLRVKLLESTSINEIDAIEGELLAIDNMRAVINEDREPNRIQAAWESDRLAIIEEDENFESKIVRQIELTETYISTLERLESDAIENGANDQAAAYAERRKLAENKLNEQRSERELALTVSNDRTDRLNKDSGIPSDGVNTASQANQSSGNDVAQANVANAQPNESSPANLNVSKVDAASIASTQPAANAADTDLAAAANTGVRTTNPSIQPNSKASTDNAASYAEQQRLDRISALQKQIDATTDEAQRDRLMADIQVLNTPLQEGEILVNQPMVQAAEVGSELDLKRTAQLTQRMQKVEGYLDAQEIIDGLDDLIGGVDAELEAAESKVRQKSLDREREDLFIERGEALVARSNAAAVANKQVYNERRQQLLGALKTTGDRTPNTESLAMLQTHFATEQQRADAAMQKADQLRSANLKTRDDVKKGDAYQEALALELEAIAIQERLLELGSLSDQLIVADAEVINRIVKGAPAIVPTALAEEALAGQTESTTVSDSNSDRGSDDVTSADADTLADADALTDADENAAANEETSAPEALSQSSNFEDADAVSTEAGDGNDASADSANAAVTADETNVSADNEAAEPDEVPNLAQTVDAATVAAREARVQNLRSTVQLPTEPIASLEESSAANANLNDAEVDEAANVRRNEIAVRNAIVRDLNALTNRITLLEQAVVNAGSEAEADGLAEELGILYRSAEIRYTELAEAEAAVKTAENALEAAIETANANATAPLNNRVTESTVVMTVETQPAPEVAENSTADVLAEAINYAKTTASKPDYYFVLPEAIVESFFEVNSESVYSAARPIPVDVPMPEGLVYKVQVGAYRKPIPQDLFKGFAPLRGEKLDNGITRYTAGVFVGFSDADQAKSSIRQMGYRDAFVVAYYNGKRISLTEARTRGNEPTIASSSTPRTNALTSSTAATANRNSAANAVTDAPVSTAAASPEVPAFAEDWTSNKGVWLTVQVGVYSRPVTLADLYNISNVMAEPLDGKRIRYTSGKFNSLERAQQARNAARAAGIDDAFLTAYIDGRRVPVAEALARLGASSTTTPAAPTTQVVTPTPAPQTANAATGYRIKIGAFQGQVPAATVTALLSLESTWGIQQEQVANGIVFYSRKLTSRAEAEKALSDFYQFGVVAVTIEEITP